MTRRWAFALAIIGVIVAMTAGLALTQLPVIGAGGLLHPARTRVVRAAPDACRDATFAGAGVTLKGWRCSGNGVRRGTIVYLHGTADNRTSSAGVIGRFGPRGLDVIAYDSRGHGESGGAACTYGFFEKHDLHGVLDTIRSGPIVLLGTSLGGAVALQEAAGDRRVTAVIAVETFSDLRTVAAERAPFFFTKGTIRQTFQLAAEQGHFDVDAVSPERAAADITVPVLLVHGAMDIDTRPEHSQRVFAALKGPKRLILVPNAGHNGSLRPEVWEEIERWIDQVLAAT
jgi:pimeloyl-ACP methyl ester carboxylesterase